jgi:catechol 2,3-dioxygenase-like lactoylglutathione lyase family enzyme
MSMLPRLSVPPRLSVVTVGARDLPSLRRFYGTLGWQEAEGSDDGWTAYLVGGVLFALYPLAELSAEAGAVAPPAGTFSGVTLACNVDSPHEVDTAFDAAVAAGATPVAAPVTREWGGRSGYIADPEGNRWEIAWAPTARFDARGALIAFGS